MADPGAQTFISTLPQWLPSVVSGAAGGLIMYWLSGRRYINQRWWDKRFETYQRCVQVLAALEASLRSTQSLLNSSPPSGSAERSQLLSSVEAIVHNSSEFKKLIAFESLLFSRGSRESFEEMDTFLDDLDLEDFREPAEFDDDLDMILTTTTLFIETSRQIIVRQARTELHIDPFAIRALEWAYSQWDIWKAKRFRRRYETLSRKKTEQAETDDSGQ